MNYLLGKMIVAAAVSVSVPGMIIDAMTEGYAAGYADAGRNIDELGLDDRDEWAQTGVLVLERSKRLREAIGGSTRQAAAQDEDGVPHRDFAVDEDGVQAALSRASREWYRLRALPRAMVPVVRQAPAGTRVPRGRPSACHSPRPLARPKYRRRP